MSDRIDTEAPMDDEYFDRFLVCSVFGPPPEEVKRARAYIAALRSELDRTREALRIAAEQCVSTTDPDEVPWLIDLWLTAARTALAEGDTEPKEAP